MSVYSEAEVQRLVARFTRNHKYAPNLDNPKTFSEKILRRMLTHDPRLPVYADKYRLKDLFPDLAVPEVQYAPCIVKPNNYSGKTKIVSTDKELRQARKTFLKLPSTYGLHKGEWWYSYIPPVVFCEQLIDIQTEVKFFCFHGRAEYILLIDGPARSWFTREGQFVDVIDDKYPQGTNILPDIGDSLSVADRVSADYDHVRVDLMIGDRIYLSEFTFAHRSGQARWSNDFDNIFGELW